MRTITHTIWQVVFSATGHVAGVFPNKTAAIHYRDWVEHAGRIQVHVREVRA